MIGDAFAKGRRGNTYAKGPEFKEKNSEGRSFKHVAGRKSAADHASHGGGAKETSKVAKRARATAGPKYDTTDRQAPHKQKERKEVRHIDQGQILNEWTQGKRKDYK